MPPKRLCEAYRQTVGWQLHHQGRLPALIGQGHWKIEQGIRSSGLDWTFLRPGFFMQNFLNMAEMIKGMGKVMMPIPTDMGLGMIDVRDTADVSAGNPDHRRS